MTRTMIAGEDIQAGESMVPRPGDVLFDLDDILLYAVRSRSYMSSMIAGERLRQGDICVIGPDRKVYRRDTLSKMALVKPAQEHGSVGAFIPPMPTTFSVSTAEVDGILTPPDPIRTPIEDVADEPAPIPVHRLSETYKLEWLDPKPSKIDPIEHDRIMAALRRTGEIRAGCYGRR
jgi:hypothetical protein